jgi:hypothetical protein
MSTRVAEGFCRYAPRGGNGNCLSLRWMEPRLCFRAAAIATFLVACNTPTIPIPPPGPEPQDVVVATYDLDPSKLVFTGGPEVAGASSSFPGGARVTLYDDDAGDGTIVTADADGTFVSDPVTGGEGDRVRIWYEDEAGTMSKELCLVVTLGRQSQINVTACPE